MRFQRSIFLGIITGILYYRYEHQSFRSSGIRHLIPPLIFYGFYTICLCRITTLYNNYVDNINNFLNAGDQVTYYCLIIFTFARPITYFIRRNKLIKLLNEIDKLSVVNDNKKRQMVLVLLILLFIIFVSCIHMVEVSDPMVSVAYIVTFSLGLYVGFIEQYLVMIFVEKINENLKVACIEIILLPDYKCMKSTYKFLRINLSYVRITSLAERTLSCFSFPIILTLGSSILYTTSYILYLISQIIYKQFNYYDIIKGSTAVIGLFGNFVVLIKNWAVLQNTVSKI